ncbi:MAG TPA: multicopper oxidase [Chloroflexota bacterium]|nr:multicopper oxidase [Chloroflexota bacterium]
MATAAGAAAALAPGAAWAGTARMARRAARRALAGGSLDPTAIPKFVSRLVVPPAMPPAGTAAAPADVDYYEIAMRQLRQQVLPAPFPQTTVWGYGSVRHPDSFHAPSFTIEARHRRPVRVRWLNELLDGAGGFLPHLLPVDPTLHWANPPGGLDGRDGEAAPAPGPARYTGPVPIVTHVHGIHATQESDGHPEAWYLPAARNIPARYATTGTYFDAYRQSSPLGEQWGPGAAVFEYPNDQAAATLWYHDHALGITRLNVYAGPAGFYLLRGGEQDLPEGTLPGPAPRAGDPPNTRYYEIPLAIQDRSFNADGSLFYPDSRAFFDALEGPYIPESDVPPIWNPEFFGNSMMVNGRTWPYLEVEPRRYRLRLLNGCNARFLLLRFSRPGLRFFQIGGDGGFLPEVVPLDQLLLGPAERADVIVDFTGLAPGTQLLLENLGPDEPFGGGTPGTDFEPADAETTGQVLQLRVVPLAGEDRSTPPERLTLPRPAAMGREAVTRRLSLNERMSRLGDHPVEAQLGVVRDGRPHALDWGDPLTEHAALDATELWELHNATADAHPIHLHLVQFEVVGRRPLAGGAMSAPEPWERGRKDTVIAFPDQVTAVRAHFDRAGLFVWHCHILEHEDNEMMRPLRVGPAAAPGALFALRGTPDLWVAGEDGRLHWASDTRALGGKRVDWSSRQEVGFGRLRDLPRGEPWVSAPFLIDRAAIYAPNWEVAAGAPQLARVRTLAELEFLGVDASSYGRLVLSPAEWEARTGFRIESLTRLEGGVLPAFHALRHREAAH